MMAQRIECHCDQEIVIASALPNPIPADAAVFCALIALSLPFLGQVRRAERSNHLAVAYDTGGYFPRISQTRNTAPASTATIPATCPKEPP